MSNKENFCKNFSYNLFISSFLISLVMAKDLTSEEQDLFGNYLQIIGQNLTSIAAFNGHCIENCEENKKDS